ncbi:MAG: S-methyl-5-thioribose-1-phosphate isomerase [Bacteroidales bacterium]|nr:S-methyl-5-thioribose-1-phosphate isomerase [Bacteroidales bacterium]
MNVNGKHYETIWLKPGNKKEAEIIDQRFLPFEFKIVNLKNCDDVFFAIRDMQVRGAPLIGAAAAMGIYLALCEYSNADTLDDYINRKAAFLKSARPTAINLGYAVELVLGEINKVQGLEQKTEIALKTVVKIIDKERQNSLDIGHHGLPLIERISAMKNEEPVNILTHCNAGWLACIDYGTATAPIYLAHNHGIKVHVWVDETRPRNQGAWLTAWELQQHGIPCTIITDNAGGHLMQHGMVDLVIVGCDRASINGDAANKIGTYLKALAAHDNNIPFYVALPSSSIDWNITDGLKEIPIEERNEEEIKYVQGIVNGKTENMLITSPESKVANYGFDVTPARLITALITEKGICKPEKNSILELFPEKIEMTIK